jgi:hypothetical protein
MPLFCVVFVLDIHSLGLFVALIEAGDTIQANLLSAAAAAILYPLHCIHCGEVQLLVGAILEVSDIRLQDTLMYSLHMVWLDSRVCDMYRTHT